jgi:hypothetical protein
VLHVLPDILREPGQDLVAPADEVTPAGIDDRELLFDADGQGDLGHEVTLSASHHSGAASFRGIFGRAADRRTATVSSFGLKLRGRASVVVTPGASPVGATSTETDLPDHRRATNLARDGDPMQRRPG